MAGLYTIGHSNHSLETFIHLLQEHEITILVDVRASPFSRYNPHFNRPVLRETLAGIGIKYYYGGKVLGGRAYNSTTEDEFMAKMAKVVSMSEEDNVAMMCSEKNPKDCHRANKLCAWVHRNYPDVYPQHIHPDGLIDSRGFEAAQKQAWLYHEFGGEDGPEDE